MIFAVCVRPVARAARRRHPASRRTEEGEQNAHSLADPTAVDWPSSRRRPLRAQSQTPPAQARSLPPRSCSRSSSYVARRRCDRLGRLDRDRGRRLRLERPGRRDRLGARHGLGSGSASSFSSLLTRRSSVLRERSRASICFSRPDSSVSHIRYIASLRSAVKPGLLRIDASRLAQLSPLDPFDRASLTARP